jgi:hypothetical protein
MPLVYWLAFALLSVVVLLQGFVMLELLRQVAELRERSTDTNEPSPLQLPSLGKPIDTAFMLQSLTSESPTLLHSLLAAGSTAFVFLHPGCGSCDSLAAQLREFPNGDSVDRVVPIVGGRSEAEASKFMERTHMSISGAFFDGGEFAYRLGIVSRPSAVVVRNLGVVSAASVHTAEAVRRLLEAAHGMPDGVSDQSRDPSTQSKSAVAVGGVTDVGS